MACPAIWEHSVGAVSSDNLGCAGHTRGKFSLSFFHYLSSHIVLHSDQKIDKTFSVFTAVRRHVRKALTC